jgi:hypothetical protein
MSRLGTFAGFSVATLVATLAVAWPIPTHADGASPLATYTVGGWKIGDVVASGDIKADRSAKSGWVVIVTARNEADHPEQVALETDVTRVAMSPMVRAAPMPTTVWSTTEPVTVPAHAAITRRYEIPVAIATQIGAARALAKAPIRTKGMPAPIVSFAVAFDRQAKQLNPAPIAQQ